MDVKNIEDSLIDALFGAGPPPVEDDAVLPTTGLEIAVDSTWIPTTPRLWRSWTGFRRVLGQEYHGPVFRYDSADDEPPFSGKRLCACPACQEHVEPTQRPN